MKSNKISRILALAVILALLVVALPATPALAAERIDLDPDEGEIGEYFYVEGRDFTPSAYTPPPGSISEVDIYFSSEEADENDDIGDEVENYKRLDRDEEVDDDGDFRVRVRVPDELRDGDEDEDVHGGTYYVYVTYDGNDNIEAVAEFTVIAGELELDPDDGAVGTELEITGTGFSEREDITIEYDDDDIDIESGDDETDSDGEFTSTIIIPESVAGEHTITVTDGAGSKDEVTFTVEPEITINPESGSPGTNVTITGTGFGYRNDVTIEFDGDEVISDETDTDGSFKAYFIVPTIQLGTYDVEAEDEDKNKDKVQFAAAAGANLSKSTGNVGDSITVNGSGFRPNATITITYATEPTPVATETADAYGAFSASFTIPKSRPGNQTITATDGTNTVTSTFTMESTAPPIPAPLIPQQGIKAKAEAYFDWEDVDDPSGVTYTLQIATDENFTDTSIVLEKEGLTKSEYTLTKEERLPSVKKEAPYYWRVQAVDGASNASGWTAPGSFYIGFAFPEMKGWPLYILIGLGFVFLLLLGLWLGRKSAYY